MMPLYVLFSDLMTAKHYPSALLLILVLLWTPLAGADANAFKLGYDIPYRVLVDASGSLNADAVANLPEEHFREYRRSLADGYRRDVYWLRFYIPAELFQGEELWLELFPPYLDDVRLFYRSEPQQTWQQQLAGDRLARDEGRLDYRFVVFPLPAPSLVSLEVLIRIESSSVMMLEGTFWTPRDFTEQATRSTAFWSFYLGLAVLSTLLAIAITLVLRSRVMLAVTCFSISYLFLASMQGFTHWVLFPGWPLLNHHLTSISNLLLLASMLWVGREALELPRFYPRIDKLYVAAILLLTLMLLSIPLDRYGEVAQLGYLIAEVLKVGLVIIAVLLWRREGLQYAWIGVVYALFTLSTLMAIMTLLGWIPLIPGVYLFWQNLLVLLMLVVTGVSVYRVAVGNRELRDKEQLARELQIERDASFRQRQFLGMVSHEFRTPLSVIAATAVNLSLNPPLDQTELDDRVRKIQRSVRRLTQLTDNCLADARISVQPDLYQTERADIFILLQEAAEIVAITGSHRLILTINGDVTELSQIHQPCYLQADKALLRIALSNLLDNAIKYSPPGDIHVSVECRSDALSIKFSTHSPRISSDLAEVIFDRYVKGSTQEGHYSSTGAGLGLYVARQIVRAHGGELSMLSSNDTETVFEIRLPVDAQE